MRLTSRVTLTAGVPRVDIHTEIDNRARDHRLRVHFTAPFAVQDADYDGHFEVVRRPVGVPAFDDTWSEQPRPEVPQRAFTAISDGQNGLLVANRGLPEVEVLRRADGSSEVALTLLRCVGWLSRDDFPDRKGAAGPILATPGAQMPGKWAFDYAVIPFLEAARLNVYHQAYAFQTPLRAVTAALHAGILPAHGSLLHAEPEEFAVSAVRTAEDGSGWIVRGYNLSGKPVTVRLETPLPYTTVWRANLLDERLEALTATPDQAIELELKGHEVVSVLFGQEKPPTQRI